jgi:hypothetical protein
VWGGAVIPLDVTQKPNVAALPASFSSLVADSCIEPDIIGMRVAERALSSTAALTVTSTYTGNTESKISMLTVFQTVPAVGVSLPPSMLANETNPKGVRYHINRLVNAWESI